jgi:hypothetical protein
MTIAYVKNSDGTGGTVQNTFRDAAGTLHTLLSDYYTDDAGTQHLIFRDELITTPVKGGKRIFTITDNRRFVATVTKDEVGMTCQTIDEFCAVKDPGEILDYVIDYEAVMNETEPPDSIVASSWLLDLRPLENTLAIDDDTQFSTIDTTVWISGGTLTGLGHLLTNHVTCASGRHYERTIVIWIKSK